MAATQTTPEKRPEAARAFAASGISKAPGTRTTSMSSAATWARFKASSAPSRSLSVTPLLKRLITTAKRMPGALGFPSQILAMRTGSLSPERGLPLLEKSVHSFSQILGAAENPEERGLEEQPLFEIDLEPLVDRE